MKITVKFLSDWHIGIGAGVPGDVDKLVARDRDDLPYVPARSLLGMWRDAAEDLAWGLDKAARGNWLVLVEALFGSEPHREDRSRPENAPTRARISITDARLPEALRTELKKSKRLRDATTFVAPSVSIDENTGAAADNKLFFTELARVGLTVEADASVDWSGVSDADRAVAEVFLRVAAAGIRVIGGKRRRGKGQCKVRIDEQTSKALLAELESLPTKQAPSLPAPTYRAPAPAPLTLTKSGTSVLQVTLKAETPIVLHEKLVGNLNKTSRILPGAVLLSVIHRCLPDLDLFAAMVGTHLQVRFGFPEVNGQRATLTPLCFFEPKQGGAVRNFLAQLPEKNDTQQYKALREKPAVWDGKALHIGKVETGVYTHNVINDEEQRPSEKVGGGVYSVEAVDAGQVFVAEIHGSTELIQKIEAALHKDKALSLGRVTHAGYGQARIVSVTTVQATQPAATPGALTLLLSSPLLFRDAALRPSTDPRQLLPLLKKTLGVDLRWNDEKSYLRVWRGEGWQRSWGLARPSLVGLAPGCVLSFAFTGNIPAEKLAQLQREGLGERRGEGFGEIQVNPGLLVPKELAKGEVKAADDKKDKEPVVYKNIPGSVRYAAARAWIARKIAEQALPEAWRGAKPSQLGALRASLTMGQSAQAARSEWLSAVKGAKKERVSKRLQSHIADADPWSQVGAPPPNEFDPALKDELTDEALRDLLIHWCQLLMRDKPNQNEVNHGA